MQQSAQRPLVPSPRAAPRTLHQGNLSDLPLQLFSLLFHRETRENHTNADGSDLCRKWALTTP